MVKNLIRSALRYNNNAKNWLTRVDLRSKDSATTFIVRLCFRIESLVAFHHNHFRKNLLLIIRISINEGDLIAKSNLLRHFVLLTLLLIRLSNHDLIPIAVNSDATALPRHTTNQALVRLGARGTRITRAEFRRAAESRCGHIVVWGVFIFPEVKAGLQRRFWELGCGVEFTALLGAGLGGITS